MIRKNIDYSLYLVADSNFITMKNMEPKITDAIKGGVTIIQLRAKDISGKEFFNLGKKLKRITDYYDIPLIINDRADIAIALNANGVHIGQEDIPPYIVRKFLGKNKILGVSVPNIKEAAAAASDGANYLGTGAVFQTRTKNDACMVKLSTLKEIKKNSRIPVIAIGGINTGNIKQVLAAGVDGIAVISGILGMKNTENSAFELKKIISQR